MITHHLSDKLLLAYSAGTLPEAFNLAVATHIAMCDDCRARALSYDAVGGALLADSLDDDVSMHHTALAATMARIAVPAPDPGAMPLPKADSVLPGPLRDYVGGGTEAIRWRGIGGGVRQAILPTSASATARMLYIPAGTAVPDHGHGGLELTLVLQGAFADETARFGRGDIEIADADLNHQPIAEPGEDCICLAVTDAPLKFRKLLPRLAQPFLRI